MPQTNNPNNNGEQIEQRNYNQEYLRFLYEQEVQRMRRITRTVNIEEMNNEIRKCDSESQDRKEDRNEINEKENQPKVYTPKQTNNRYARDDQPHIQIDYGDVIQKLLEYIPPGQENKEKEGIEKHGNKTYKKVKIKHYCKYAEPLSDRIRTQDGYIPVNQTNLAKEIQTLKNQTPKPQIKLGDHIKIIKPYEINAPSINLQLDGRENYLTGKIAIITNIRYTPLIGWICEAEIQGEDQTTIISATQAQKIQEPTKPETPKDVTIGSDPEFIIQKNYPPYKQIPASNIIKGNTLRTRIGCDGRSTTGELRPRYSKDAIEHIKNIKTLIITLTRTYETPNIIITAGLHKSQPIGGHIHFGTQPTTALIQALDIMQTYMLQFYTPTLRIRHRRRLQEDYGKLTSIRPQKHGFEYRAPLSWIANPKLTAWHLVTAHTIAYETVNNPQHTKRLIAYFKKATLQKSMNQKNDKEYTTRSELTPEQIQSYKEAEIEIFETIHKELEQYLTHTIKYKTDQRYKQTIDEMIQARNKKEKTHGNIISRTWKIEPKRQKPRPKENIITGRKEDIKIPEIIENTTKKQSQQENTIYLYGLKDNNKAQILLSNSDYYDLVENELCNDKETHTLSLLTRKIADTGTKGRLPTTGTYGTAIGLTKRVRTRYPQLAIKIANAIQEKIIMQEAEDKTNEGNKICAGLEQL